MKHTPPVFNSSSTVSMDLSITLLQIEDVSTRFQSLKMQTWMMMTWKDGRLAWDPHEYDNIMNIRVPSSMVWEPDVMLWNSPTGVHFTRVPLVLYHDGSLTHVRPTSIKSRCSIDKHRPNDSFTCKLKFGSWTYDGNMFDIKMKAGERGFDMAWFQQNPNYAVISTNSTRHVEYYPCCPEPYVDITFEITLQRRQV
ncbi:acetylcholine receptor subunit alpha-L1-like [Gigantopelta aegis]|uniref:acetylcholine receptor subunit alpha-L1-like n=1 Tax=Gigantopelta aegis TaxID=1735272 RepID=UPI001B88C21C|nr:acetylcholine receptor subunit alpha-L1-like [Gigantopelta aegis]